MTLRNETRTIVAALLACAMPAAWAQGSPQEFLPLVKEYLNPDAGNVEVTVDLLNPKIGPQFSERWDVRNAFGVFRDKLAPSQECFLATRPGGDPDIPVEACEYTRGSASGDGSASLMRINLASGGLKYLNRGRNPDMEGPVKVTEEDALEFALRSAELLGIPTGEMARDFIQTNRLRVAAGSPQQEKPVVMDMEVQVTVPRCMPVEGQVIQDCVPVFNSGLRTTVVDGPALSWLKSEWTDFRLSRHILEPVPRDEVELRTAEALARNMTPGTVNRLMTFVSYVQLGDLGNGETQTACVPSNNEESGASTAGTREFVPAVVVYAEPNDPGELKPESNPPPQSTAGYQFAVPLVTTGGCDRPQAG